MLMTSIEIKIPASAKDYVLDDTTEEMRNVHSLGPFI